MNKAGGTFDVKINSLPPYNTSAEAKLARMSIDKQAQRHNADHHRHGAFV